MDITQTKLVPSTDICDERRFFRDLSNIYSTASEKLPARTLSELKKKRNLNDPTTGIPHEIEQSWQKSIVSLNNLFSDMSFQNSPTKFDEGVDFEKGVEFKSSDEEASKIETVDVSPIPTAQNLQPSVRCEGQGIQVAERDVYLKKPPIKVNNGFTKARHYKHTYFDDDGQEIDESNKTHSHTTKLPFLSPDDRSKVPPIISTHFNMKSLVKYPNQKGNKKYRSNKQTVANFESWFSVVPENVAEHIAKRCRSGVIIDCFCGAGGNAIQFATRCNKVIALDTDPDKIEIAKHNATMYGVKHRIKFIVGDFLTLVDSFKADVIFLSPPWEPDSSKKDVYDVETAFAPVSASELMKLSRKITQNIVIYLPSNSNIDQLAKLAGPERPVEIEKCSLNGELIAVAAYYGTLFNKQ